MSKRESPPVEGSKAKYIRDLLDKALELRVPAMSPEEFERIFNIKASPAEIRNFTFAEIMVRQLVVKACAGNDKSIQEVLDRLLGKPMQTTESVSKSYTYHDFLIQCQQADEAEAKPKNITPPKKPAEVTDILADLM